MTDASYSESHHRRSIRLAGHDYTQAGAYFVTLCTWEHRCLFGDVLDGAVVLDEVGRIVEAEWLRTLAVRANVELDAFVIMPNHLHGILVLRGGRATRRVAPTAAPVSMPVRPKGPAAGSVGAIVGQFKSNATKRIWALGDAGLRVWQRNYYEHVIRNEQDLASIRDYIGNNPARWAEDVDNPDRLSQTDGRTRRGDPAGRPYDRIRR